MFEYFNFVHFAGWCNFSKIIIFLTIVIICLFIRGYKSKHALQKLTASKWRKKLILHGSMIQKIVKNIFFFIGCLFVAIALLRPQWDKKEEKVQQEGRDLLIAVDISRSMLGQDVKPNRLEFAKQKIKKIVMNLSCERIGLLLFSGDTVVQCPLTKDYSAFFMFLAQLDVETISSGTTTLDGAIAQALAVFENMPTKRTKLLCLFTDG
ncbi:VWA domain-containing protein, partial [Candidatus Babeliales bacterium]|nr:VWA domain-containing protein [Candidatus Babeliales bacterium]